MLERAIQEKILRKLMNMSPPKWGGSHTEEVNLVKGLPKHLRGERSTTAAIEELFHREWLLRMKKTGEWHVSLNPERAGEIYDFLGLPLRD